MIIQGIHMSRSIKLVVCTTFIKNLAHVLCRLYLEIMVRPITLNGKSDVLQSLQERF